MIDKLVQLLEGKTSQGIKHRFGEEMISKGVKFNRKNINEGCSREEPLQGRKQLRRSEEVNLNAILEGWTADARVNGLVLSWCVSISAATPSPRNLSVSALP
jgi:DNA-directed RNA polymerase subunit beta